MIDNEGGWYNWTSESEESKEKYEVNENDAMEWNERIGMKMDKSEIDWSGWEKEWDGNGWKWMDIEHRCKWQWKQGKSGDEGDGVEIGRKGG